MGELLLSLGGTQKSVMEPPYQFWHPADTTNGLEIGLQNPDNFFMIQMVFRMAKVGLWMS